MSKSFDSTFQNREILRNRKWQTCREQCYHFPNTPLQVVARHSVIVAMEWTNYHMRVTIIGLMKAGKNAKQIHTLLKPLKVNKCFVYHVLVLYNNTGDIVDQLRSRWLCTASKKKVVEAVCAGINRNPVRRQKTIAKEMNIAPRTLSRI